MTEPNDPAWTDEEIDARRNEVQPTQPTVIDGIGPVSQDPDAFPLDDEETD
ncbi:hypothetical protein [Actinoallomurus iriomotensis]|uniref:Uncharacterized protein n=1 Tax=Actinoallomurus iriomotensis TaxID=478107 RepID=A0A9W6RU58_9ACTN|nr:hypothetical protein [Actinoallomurus iriomotensis]GLY81825.1 hypothetical protein Airi01_100920 [Actinoallomurus iriomotensis]